MQTIDIPQKPAHRRAWINYQLFLRGLSFASLGREYGVTRQAVSNAVSRPYPKFERVIAQKLGRRPEEIWPERYDAYGRPNRNSRGVIARKPIVAMSARAGNVSGGGRS